MKDCDEDLLVDISEILFNELAFYKLMQELDGYDICMVYCDSKILVLVFNLGVQSLLLYFIIVVEQRQNSSTENRYVSCSGVVIGGYGQLVCGLFASL